MILMLLPLEVVSFTHGPSERFQNSDQKMCGDVERYPWEFGFANWGSILVSSKRIVDPRIYSYLGNVPALVRKLMR